MYCGNFLLSGSSRICLYHRQYAHSYPYTHPNSYSDTYPDTYANADADSYPNSYAAHYTHADSGRMECILSGLRAKHFY